MASEFDLIARHFKWPAPAGVLGVGDDCALLPVASDRRLAVTTDLLIEGRHFLHDADPEALGHKALAVNVSDLAAMGATPIGCVLGLSVPRADHAWLERFARGFRTLADAVGCPLVGGDTTRSLQGTVISVTAMGEVPAGAALTRAAARPGDDIWITGTLGAAHMALEVLQGRERATPDVLAALRPFLDRPEPPVAFGAHLIGIAHAAIDISDGLQQDLGHVLRASGCGAEIDYASLPVHPALEGFAAASVQRAVLNGGDVYQLCFTASAAMRQRITELAGRHGVRVSRVGTITQEGGLRVTACPVPLSPDDPAGFDHFG